MKKTFIIIITVLLLAGSSYSQIIDGTYKEISSSDSSVFIVALEIKLVDGSAKIGNSVARFQYDTDVLSFPLSPQEGDDYIMHTFSEASYYTSISQPTPGTISINIANTSLDNGATLSTDELEIARLYFTKNNTGTIEIQPKMAEFYSPNSSDEWQEGTWEFEASVLPVEITYFTASAEKDHVLLEWETATEVNNYGFFVERSLHKDTWEELGFVEGSGNSSSAKYYSFQDMDPILGKAYYRLKQVDLDGGSIYSKIISVNFDLPSDLDDQITYAFKLNQNYPNPFNPSTQISYELPSLGYVELKVYDILGAEVKNLYEGQQSEGKYEMNWTAGNLPAGVYFLRMFFESSESGERFTDIKKMILLK